MKNFLTLILIIAGGSVFGQREIDENGRPIGAKPAFLVSNVEDVYLKKNESFIAGAEVKLDYSLPKGVTSGKLTLFHPRKDEELQSYTLSSETGSVTVNVKEMPVSFFSAGLYDPQGKLVKSLNVID
ncbi:hypothetical protein [Jiulongibacter sp. NS-SX5]|uniref:hypothetical protein n=1 Tax=Jiulongibacter sp. NS-SX5 TaxID=3463854 RepID=UPI0040593359